MSKRKRESFEDSDEDEPLLGRRVLPVANLPGDFDQVPTDGMQYLFTVRRDARLLPHITRAANPYDNKDAPSPVPFQDDAFQLKHPELPSEEWRMLFEERFKNFRTNVVQPTISVGDIPQPQMPDHRERDLWWAFIAGRPESEWNSPKISKKNARRYRRIMSSFCEETEYDASHVPQETWHINDEGEVELALRIDPSESLPTPSGTPAPPDAIADDRPGTSTGQKESATLAGREPTPTLMKFINHRLSLRLLMYFTHWIKVHLNQPETASSRLTETHARWIFALLSRVESYIPADDTNQLRSLARGVLTLLKQRRSRTENGDVMSECSCWIIICAVVGVWGQRDLWAEAGAMLAGTDT